MRRFPLSENQAAQKRPFEPFRAKTYILCMPLGHIHQYVPCGTSRGIISKLLFLRCHRSLYVLNRGYVPRFLSECSTQDSIRIRFSIGLVPDINIVHIRFGMNIANKFAYPFRSVYRRALRGAIPCFCVYIGFFGGCLFVDIPFRFYKVKELPQVALCFKSGICNSYPFGVPYAGQHKCTFL